MMRKDDVNIRSMFFVKFVFSFLSLLEGRGKYYRGLSLSPLIPLSQLSREKERERENEESWKKSERKKKKGNRRKSIWGNKIFRCWSSWCLIISWKFQWIEIGKSQPIIALIMGRREEKTR